MPIAASDLAALIFGLALLFGVIRSSREEFGRDFVLALIAVVTLQVVVVHWTPTQRVFDTVDLTLAEWGLAALVASSALLFEEMRKLVLRVLGHGFQAR